MTKLADKIEEVVDCPRCHEQCGWCADYRWMHGTMRLPNQSTRKQAFCTLAGFKPDGDDCPMCGGALKVLRTTTYAALRAREASK